MNARDVKIIQIPLKKLVLDPSTQMRAGENEGIVALDPEHLADMLAVLASGGDLRPIDVVHDALDDIYFVWDGHHRSTCYLSDELRPRRKYINGTITREGTLRDAVLLSLGANARERSLPRSNLDKRRCLRTALNDEEWGAWSSSEIARVCNVSQSFVSEWRSILSPRQDSSCGVNKLVRRGASVYQQKKPVRTPPPAELREMSADEQIAALNAGQRHAVILQVKEDLKALTHKTEDRVAVILASLTILGGDAAELVKAIKSAGGRLGNGFAAAIAVADRLLGWPSGPAPFTPRRGNQFRPPTGEPAEC